MTVDLDPTSIGQARRRWLVTGAAGFIGSHLTQELLKLDQEVVGIDDLSTGVRENLEAIRSALVAEQWNRFTFVKGDVRDPALLENYIRGVDGIFHQAATSSVTLSTSRPLETFANNTESLLALLVAAEKAGVPRVVYASSAAVYGMPSNLPIREEEPSAPLSLYGLTKKINEETADFFARRTTVTGLRYFNVYGPRQSPDSAYAGVISVFSHRLTKRLPLVMFGDGKTSRDFLFVKDVVDANLRAALRKGPGHQIYNVGTGSETTLLELAETLTKAFGLQDGPSLEFAPVRPGDIPRSVANTDKAMRDLGFKAKESLAEGLDLLLASLRRP